MTFRNAATIVRFLIVGVGNTLVGLTFIFLFLRLGASDVAANALGYSVGLSFSFFANRSWTFRHSGPVWPALWRFLLVFAVAYSLNLATTLMMLRLLGSGSFLAQVAGIMPYTILSYLGSRLVAFKPERETRSIT